MCILGVLYRARCIRTFLLDCAVTQTLPMVVLSHMQYLEQELRIEGLSFPFDLEVR